MKQAADATLPRFAGIGFSGVGLEVALESVDRRPADAPFAYVVTPNVDHVVRLNRTGFTYASMYEEALLCLCDSAVLAALMRLLRVKIPKAPGSDLVGLLLANAVRPGDILTVVGCSVGVVDALRKRHPEAVIHHHEPPMNFILDPEATACAVAFVEAHPARFVFLCLGSPQQELLAYCLKRRGHAKGTGLCCGIAIHYATGSIRRAPVAARRLGLEWLFRMMSEPGRLWRRYMIEGPYVFLLFLKELHLTSTRSRASSK